MSHLTTESLARLVDETPDAAEQLHLDACASCRAVLDELRAQTRALAALPSYAPSSDAWESIGRRMREAEHRALQRRRIFAHASYCCSALSRSPLFE